MMRVTAAAVKEASVMQMFQHQLSSLKRSNIVYQSCLDCLCRERGKPVSEMFTHGSMVGYKISCLGNCSYIWRSQPQKNKLAEENLLITFAIVLTGYIFGRTSEFSSALNLQLFSQSTFSNIQKEHVFPVVQQAWRAEKTAVVEMFRKESSVVLANDAQCDSPGNCARYGAYAFIDVDGDGKKGSRKIVDVQLAQCTEVFLSL